MTEALESLRQRVEKKFNTAIQTGSEQEWAEVYQDFLTTIEELLAAEEELREQNEQLLASSQELEAERQRFHELYEFAPQAYLVTDLAGTIENANRAAGELLKTPPEFLIGKPLSMYVAPVDALVWQTILDQHVASRDIEIRLQPRGGGSADVVVRMTPWHSAGQQGQSLLWVLIDITERKRAQHNLIQSEERFRQVFSSSPTGIALLKRTGEIFDANPALCELLCWQDGYPQGKDILEVISPEDRPQVRDAQNFLYDNAVPPRQVEARLLAEDGRKIWVRLGFGLLLERSTDPSTVLLVTDLTAEKEAAAVRVEMQRRMLDRVEDERSYLARELHDSPLQDLYGVLFQLSNVDGKKKNEDEKQILADAQANIQEVINKLRKLCGELRPPSLIRYGLDKALRSYVDSATAPYPDLQVRYLFQEDLPVTSDRIALALFRVTQQCVMNTLRHGQASQLTIRLEPYGDGLLLVVEDDGAGFEMPNDLLEFARNAHYGLANIAERVETINGQLVIQSQPGKGTRIEVYCPLTILQ